MSEWKTLNNAYDETFKTIFQNYVIDQDKQKFKRAVDHLKKSRENAASILGLGPYWQTLVSVVFLRSGRGSRCADSTERHLPHHGPIDEYKGSNPIPLGLLTILCLYGMIVSSREHPDGVWRRSEGSTPPSLTWQSSASLVWLSHRSKEGSLLIFIWKKTYLPLYTS